MLTRILSTATLAVLVAATAVPEVAAEEGRAVDMTAALHDEFGRDAKDMLEQAKDDPDCARCPPLTLGRACAHALFASFADEQAAPDQKWARAVLAMRIRDDKAAHLDADEIAVIKRLVGKAYGGIVLMQIYPMLDPNAKPPAVK
jgi:hypothetical protein